MNTVSPEQFQAAREHRVRSLQIYNEAFQPSVNPRARIAIDCVYKLYYKRKESGVAEWQSLLVTGFIPQAPGVVDIQGQAVAETGEAEDLHLVQEAGLIRQIHTVAPDTGRLVPVPLDETEPGYLLFSPVSAADQSAKSAHS